MTLPPIPGWQAQAGDAAFSDPATCAVQATKFERQIRRRNWIEYAAGVLVTFLFGGTAISAFAKGELLIGLSAAMIIAGTGLVLWSLHKRASNLDRRPEDRCLDHLRRQYEHQYRALRDVPLWYIGPFIPGLVLFYVAIVASTAEVTGWGSALKAAVTPMSITFGIVALVALANWLGARALKRKIEQLDALA